MRRRKTPRYTWFALMLDMAVAVAVLVVTVLLLDLMEVTSWKRTAILAVVVVIALVAWTPFARRLTEKKDQDV